MTACVIVPYWKEFMQGFNEIAQSECAAILLNRGWQVDELEGAIFSRYDLILLIAQYREDARGVYLSQFQKVGQNAIVCVYGKAANEARFHILRNNSDIDFVIRGEAEITLLEIARKVETNNLVLSDLKGITYRNERDGIVDTENQNCPEDYDASPMPTCTYLNKGREKFPICVLNSSRGCHGDCYFCEGNVARKQINGAMYRSKSPQRVVEEIEYVIKNHKRRIFSFSDDNFLVDGIRGQERAAQFAQLLLSRGIKIRFTIECRSDNVDVRLFALLRRAGLVKVFIGIESGSQVVLDRYNKGISVEQNIVALERLERVGVKCEPGYIFFDPLTNHKELYDSYVFFSKYMDKIYSPTYGDGLCRLYLIEDNALRDKWWPDISQDEWSRIANSDGEYPFLTQEAKDLYEAYQQVCMKKHKGDRETALSFRLGCLGEALGVR